MQEALNKFDADKLKELMSYQAGCERTPCNLNQFRDYIVGHAETCQKQGSVKFIFGKEGYSPGQAIPVDYNKHNILGQMA